MEDPNALLKLFASAGLGAVWQWLFFGPKKFNDWAAWGLLVGASVVLYFWATPSMLTDFQGNWRIGIVGLISFILQAKGTGSAMSAAKAAPKSNSL